MKNLSFLFKISSVLWITWGLVHILAGVMTIKGVLTHDITASVSGIADAVNPESLALDYPKAAGAVFGQHGFNLLWIGVVTFISAFYVWKGNRNAVFLAALTGGLADVGYFLFLDLGGFVNFVPGTVMTIISALAIATSLYAYSKSKKRNTSEE